MTISNTFTNNSYQHLLKSITGIDIGFYADRGLIGTLTPIQATDGLVRSVNGVLMDWTSPQFRRFAVTISCSDDIDPPTFTDIWQGQVITCVFYPGLDRPTEEEESTADNTLTIETMLDSWNVTRDDYGNVSSWQINLLEIGT